jgi:hypothetical protein
MSVLPLPFHTQVGRVSSSPTRAAACATSRSSVEFELVLALVIGWRLGSIKLDIWCAALREQPRVMFTLYS